jgi:hypothetical protein
MKGAFQAIWTVARWVVLVAGLVAVVGGLLALAICVVPGVLVGAPRQGLTEADRLKAINDARAPLVTVVGGLLLFTAALVGAYLTSRTIQVNREANEISRTGQEATLEITRLTLEITRQGQITDRFTRAIDQLGQHGQDKLDVRLGGIYALERIARESAEDHGPIMEVLTAFIREHARVQPARTVRWQPVRVVGPVQPGEQALSDQDERPRLRADVQAIATVLGRRPEERRRQETARLDLRDVDLRGVYLTEAHLERARLNGAHLERAFLGGAHLEGAFLLGAHLERAILRDAHLEGAFLRDAHLEGADVNGAHLVGADLRQVDMSTVQGVTRLQLEAAITDETTIWPWPMFADEAPAG